MIFWDHVMGLWFIQIDCILDSFIFDPEIGEKDGFDPGCHNYEKKSLVII